MKEDYLVLPNFQGGFIPMPARPGHYIQIQPDPKYIEQLKRRRDAIANMCKAVETYMCLDLDYAIQTANDPVPTPVPYYTTEMLIHATEELDQMKDQYNATEKMVDDAPESTSEFMRTSILVPLKRMLDMKEKEVSMIQSELEKGDQESAT